MKFFLLFLLFCGYSCFSQSIALIKNNSDSAIDLSISINEYIKKRERINSKDSLKIEFIHLTEESNEVRIENQNNNHFVSFSFIDSNIRIDIYGNTFDKFISSSETNKELLKLLNFQRGLFVKSYLLQLSIIEKRDRHINTKNDYALLFRIGDTIKSVATEIITNHNELYSLLILFTNKRNHSREFIKNKMDTYIASLRNLKEYKSLRDYIKDSSEKSSESVFFKKSSGSKVSHDNPSFKLGSFEDSFNFNLNLRSIFDSSHKKLSLISAKHRIINIFATWCVPCISELPSLMELQKTLDSNKYEFFYISSEPYKAVSKFLSDKKISLNSFYVADNEMKSPNSVYNQKNIPANIIIPRKGNFYLISIGASDWSSIESINFLQSLSY
jgi:cytochrome c biogenesis protein CcmG/thiol:disulfide interchange protein DsbE